MKTSPSFLLALILAVNVGIPHGASAGGAKKPFNKIGEPTISAVSATSITVTHKKDKASKTNTGSSSSSNSKDAGSVTKTYRITAMTDVEIDGKSASVNDLKVGMAVSISADPSSSMGPADPTDGGEARVILAHDAPAE